jgi:hypothetical protein
MRKAFALTGSWVLRPRDLDMAVDHWVMENARFHGYPIAHSGAPTVCYRTTWTSQYLRFGKTPPPGAKNLEYEMRSVAAVKLVRAHFAGLRAARKPPG